MEGTEVRAGREYRRVRVGRMMQSSKGRQNDAKFYEDAEFEVSVGSQGEIFLEAQGKSFPSTY